MALRGKLYPYAKRLITAYGEANKYQEERYRKKQEERRPFEEAKRKSFYEERLKIARERGRREARRPSIGQRISMFGQSTSRGGIGFRLPEPGGFGLFGSSYKPKEKRKTMTTKPTIIIHNYLGQKPIKRTIRKTRQNKRRVRYVMGFPTEY